MNKNFVNKLAFPNYLELFPPHFNSVSTHYFYILFSQVCVWAKALHFWQAAFFRRVGGVLTEIKFRCPNRWHSGPISRDIAMLSLRYPVSRDTFSRRLALAQNGAIPPSALSLTQAHCATPQFATYHAIIVQYP